MQSVLEPGLKENMSLQQSLSKKFGGTLESKKKIFLSLSSDDEVGELEEQHDKVLELNKQAKKTKQNEESMVQVFLRLKPVGEEKERMRMTMNRGSITVSDIESFETEKEYKFTKIFTDEADQKTVFD